jgi:hypothetical protein
MTNEATPLREALLDGFRATLDDVLPWFKAQMPPAYFADTDAREQLVHVRAVVAARASGGRSSATPTSPACCMTSSCSSPPTRCCAR